MCSEIPPQPDFGNTTCLNAGDSRKNCTITCLEGYVLTLNDSTRLGPKEKVTYSCNGTQTDLASLPECSGQCYGDFKEDCIPGIRSFTFIKYRFTCFVPLSAFSLLGLSAKVFTVRGGKSNLLQ